MYIYVYDFTSVVVFGKTTTQQQNTFGFDGFSMVCSVTEGRCRGVVRLSFLPKAAYLEGRCQGGCPFRTLAEGRIP